MVPFKMKPTNLHKKVKRVLLSENFMVHRTITIQIVVYQCWNVDNIIMLKFIFQLFF